METNTFIGVRNILFGVECLGEKTGFWHFILLSFCHELQWHLQSLEVVVFAPVVAEMVLRRETLFGSSLFQTKDRQYFVRRPSSGLMTTLMDGWWRQILL